MTALITPQSGLGKLARLLNNPIINKPFIVIDYWSIVHFFSGFILGILIPFLIRSFMPALGLRNSFILSAIVVFTLLIIYEVFEIAGIGILFSGAETATNIVWDIIIGMFGFVIGATLFFIVIINFIK